MEKNPNQGNKKKPSVKYAAKIFMYLIVSCVVIFTGTLIASYWWMESHKMNMSDIMSDILAEIPEN